MSTTPITQWALEDRPREKLMERGEEALTKAELLGILIGSGTPQKSAVEVMAELLTDCDGKLQQLSRLSIDELTQYNGIGPAKAITIKAAMELGRRRAQEETTHQRNAFTTAEDIYNYMLPIVRDLNHEESWALLLTQSGRLIRRVRLSQGGLTETAVDVRLLMKQALLAEATVFVLVHNHPSGSCAPSKADNNLTAKIRQAADTLSIRLLDHVIVTDGDYYSYAENDKL